MVQFDFVGIKDEPTNHRLAHFIYDRFKSEKYMHTTYSSPQKERDTYARSKADAIYEYVLEEPDFYLTENKLNEFVQLITVLGNFSTWKDFEKEFSKDAQYATTRKNYMYKPFSKLSENEQQSVRSMAYRKLYTLASLYYRNGKKGEVNIIKNTSEFIIRTAMPSEINEIEGLATRIYPCPINGFHIKKPWYDKNKNIFFIYKDEFSLWANINLLPLKMDFYNRLKSGFIYEDKITANDIHSPEELTQVQCIYIEGLACTIRSILPQYVKNFEKMIATLANVKNKELIICAIGGSIEGDLIMKNYGFEITGYAMDDKRNKYAFLESTLGKLENALLSKRKFKDNYTIEEIGKKLTKIDGHRYH